jgi:methionyl-tRNA formyltransferase
MNITVLANRDLASNLALNQLLPRLAENNQLHVFLSSQVGSGANLPEPLRILKFFEQTLFNTILFPALDRGTVTTRPCTFNQLERYTTSPITVLNQVNSEAGLATLAAGSPELVISIRYGGILKDQAIAIPAHGVINLHSGLLPDYRGVMASFRALLYGESEIGTTLHYISDGSIDTGDIIGNTRMPVSAGRSYLWHVLQLYPQACELLAQLVQGIAAGQAPARQLQPSGGSYYSFPDLAELEAFAQSSHSLYDLDDITDIAKNYLAL